MKNIFALFLLLSFTVLYAQYSPGTVYFKDNSTSEGLIKVKMFEGIKFKIKEDTEVVDYTSKQIKGYDVKGWQFRYVESNSSDKPKFLKLILEGEISLYNSEVYSSGLPNSNGSSQGGITFGIGPGTSKIYFIKVNDELIKLGTKLKKKHLTIFENCPTLIEKIKNKEFKKWDFYDIIEYYNEDCNSDE